MSSSTDAGIGELLLHSPLIGPIAINSIPLRNIVIDPYDPAVDFSLIDQTYYTPRFSVTIQKSRFTESGEFPSITSYHFAPIKTAGGDTHRYAVGSPLSVCRESVMFQCFGVDEEMGVGAGYVCPGILRAPLDLVYIPLGYPRLPPEKERIVDAIDPLWNFIGPTRRIEGSLEFACEMVGMRVRSRQHVPEAIFADEFVREALSLCRSEGYSGGGVEETSLQHAEHDRDRRVKEEDT